MNFLKTTLLAVPVTLVLSGCGDWNKNPVPESKTSTGEAFDLDTLRKHSKDVITHGQDKPREITNTVIVEKPVVVVKEESTIDQKFIVITPDAQMTFNEGQEGVFKVYARVLVPGVQIALTAKNLPEGATLTASQAEKDLYLLKWNPALYTVSSNENMKTFNVKLVAEINSVSSQQNADKLKGLVREREVNLFLFKNQEAPSELKVDGLASEVAQGQEIPFSVTVKVPGIDGRTAQKPRLVISYDGVSYTTGNDFLELDGSRHVVADKNKKDPEYLGDSKWKFSLVFDTKNISVQPQLAKDGSFMVNATGLRVRLSFKAYSPNSLSTPETLSKLKIRFASQEPTTPPPAAGQATTGAQ